MKTPDPLRTPTGPVSLKSFPDLQIPRSCLNRTGDIAMLPCAFAWCPRFPAPLGLCRLVQMPGGPVESVAGLARSKAGMDPIGGSV